jgi:thiosulfate/3-mercaptopyruvate sulfurtransferase
MEYSQQFLTVTSVGAQCAPQTNLPMTFTTIISATDLAREIGRCVVVDCRHDLFDPEAGPAGYRAGHIPGAFFLHQDTDLAGPKTGRNGRHPLPEREAIRALLASLGLSDGGQLVAYDTSGGQMAVRLWWLARWIGHPEVAVLDGGLAAWSRAGLELSVEAPALLPPGKLSLLPSLAPSIDLAGVQAALASGTTTIVDARTAERYRGEAEPIDPVAGHIPGAINRPMPQNLQPDGCFKPAAVLRAEFEALLGDVAPGSVAHHCGSGIAGCHNVLAMEIAGLGGSMLYPGSWSEWCADPSRPIATGAAP